MEECPTHNWPPHFIPVYIPVYSIQPQRSAATAMGENSRQPMLLFIPLSKTKIDHQKCTCALPSCILIMDSILLKTVLKLPHSVEILKHKEFYLLIIVFFPAVGIYAKNKALLCVDFSSADRETGSRAVDVKDVFRSNKDGPYQRNRKGQMSWS